MTLPTLVIFDLDDTLYEYDVADAAGRRAITSFATDTLGLTHPEFDTAFAQARRNVKSRLGQVASSHSRLLYFHEALEVLGLRTEPQLALTLEQEYWRAYLLEARLRPGTHDLLNVLRYNDVTTAVVTDLTTQIQFRKLIYLDLADHIDHVVCSEETAGEKESGRPFELLFDRLAPDVRKEVWFIGDQLFDAPVDRFVASGHIAGGRGFIRGATATNLVQPWSDFVEIEAIVEREFREAGTK